MKVLDVRRVAREAVAANPTRPATAIVHESADARLIVFRLSPGQCVVPHRNASSVTLTVISGSGLTSGVDEERRITTGNVVTYEPNEVHGMRATDEELVLLATITPRPGSRGA